MKNYKKDIVRDSTYCNKDSNGIYRMSKLWCYLTLISILFVCACKQTKNEGNNDLLSSNKVTITIKGDAGVSIKTPTFKIVKNATWKDIKKTANEKITIQEYKEIKEWSLNNANGKLLQDAYSFEKDATIFATTQTVITTYKVEHWKENIENDEYTKVEDATETKKSEAGKETEAVAKEYENYAATPINQEKIKTDGSTLIKIYYKRDTIFLILDLKGGSTTTKLKEKNGKTLLEGKIGATIKVEEPTKNDFLFYGWKPELPKTFSRKDNNKEYNVDWSDNIRVYIKGDERLDIKANYMDFPPRQDAKWEDVKTLLQAKVSIKADLANGDYELYDWKLAHYDGERLEDNTPLKRGMTVYARTNYTKFKWEINNSGIELLVGYTGSKPKGRIIIPAKTLHLKNTTFKDCTEITAVDFSECRKIQTLNIPGVGITEIDLSKCTDLINLDLSRTRIKKIDVSNCPKLTWIDLNNTRIKDIDLLQCLELGTLNLSNTDITNINLSQCTDMVGLFLNNTKITDIVISQCPNLSILNLSKTNLTNIDVSQCTKLKQFFLEGTPITYLDVSQCKELTVLNLSKTGITNLYVLECKKLVLLDLTSTKLLNLDVSACKNLQLLLLEETPIQDLNVSGCINLVAILCKNCNNLKRVDLASTKLQSIGWVDTGDQNVRYLPFPGCVKAEVKLPNTVTEVLKDSFGKGDSTWCSKVIVPTEEIKNMVIASGYPKSKIILQ